MGFGKMNCFIEIVAVNPTRDGAGFATGGDTVLASVRAYKEDKRGTEKWANLASFSEASSLFRFRKMPGLEVTPEMVIVCAEGRHSILSVLDVRGRGMYLEVLAKKVIAGG